MLFQCDNHADVPEDRPVIKHLTRHGNSLALVLDKPILDLLHIDAETPLEISTDGASLTVKPVTDEAKRTRFQRALKEVNRKYGRALKRLGG